MNGNQLSLFDFSRSPVQTPLPSPREDINSFLLKCWNNSQDLAFCIVNVLLDTNELLCEFVEYIKTCRLSDVADEVQRPSPHKRFDRLAECLKRLEFTLFEHGDKGEVIQTETTVLDFAIDVSFDEKELDDLRAFAIQGASTEEVERLAEVIRNYVEEAEVGDTKEYLPLLDESHVHPYIAMLRRLGISEEAMPEPSDKDAVLKAILDGIGENEIKLDWVLSETNITKAELLAAGGPAERKRFRAALAKNLSHALCHFHGTEEWHRHRRFSPIPVLLTDGALYLAENGGGSVAGTAFWLMDAVASYQGEKKFARHPFQTWRLIVTPESEGKSRSAVLICGDVKKPIVRQGIEHTDFLLDGETLLYASRDEFEPGKQCLIILLPGEY